MLGKSSVEAECSLVFSDVTFSMLESLTVSGSMMSIVARRGASNSGWGSILSTQTVV